MRKAVIVSGLRTPVAKAHTGTLKDVRPDDLAALVIARVVEATAGLEKSDVDDVILGCAMPEGEQGLNIARIASIRAGLPTSVPALTVNRFCVRPVPSTTHDRGSSAIETGRPVAWRNT